MITAVDAFGREVRVSKEEWRLKVLPDNLRQAWSDAGALYRLILSALNDGIPADVEAAARRLIEIDPDRERAVTALGVILMKTGRGSDARTLFEAHLRE